MAATGTSTPVVFVHGLWLHSDSWSNWQELFRESGYAPQAPGWPGDGASIEDTRANPGAVAGAGIDDVVGHYSEIVRSLPTKPVVIGHSFGGLIAQRLLAQGDAAAAVAVDPAPIKGVYFLPPSALRVASVALRNPANRNGAVSLTKEQFRYGFGNALSQQESDDLYKRWTIPSPGKPLFEAALANFVPHSPAKIPTTNGARGPLLLTAGGRDRTVPRTTTASTRKLYRKSAGVTDYKEFPDRGHSLTIDGRWREVAETALGWMRERGL
jgi:non-heme chloroperoxidase